MSDQPTYDNPGECPKHNPRLDYDVYLEWIQMGMMDGWLRASCSVCGYWWQVTAKDEVER